MVGKGHCKIDLSSEDSEFRDFYDIEDKLGETLENGLGLPRFRDMAIDETDKTARLRSGKILSHRTQNILHPNRQRIETKENRTGFTAMSLSTTAGPSQAGVASPPMPSPTMSSADSKKVARREAVFHKQLASLRATDRDNLAHLPLWKQQAIVTQGKKQVEKARRDENEMSLKIQLKANKTSKK